MSQSGVEDAAFAVGDRHEQRFLFAAAALLLCGEGAREDRHVLRRTAQPAIKLILGVHPFWRQTGHNRVLGRTCFHHKGVLLAMATARPGSGKVLKVAILETKIRS